ncbi:MAG TPA: hypothetical protein VF422_10900 [Dokdonella sp.]
MEGRTTSATAWIPITAEMRATLHAHAAAAIERLESFGMGDRRESAFALLLAGSTPLLGMVLLGWEPAGGLAVLLVNLLVGLGDDIVKILRSRGRWDEVLKARAQDEFVWPVARALASGKRTVYAKMMPDRRDVEAGRTQAPLWFAALLAFLVAGSTLFLISGPGARIGSGSTVFLGSAPSIALALASSLFHGWNRHPHWRMAGSVRLQTATATAFFIATLAWMTFLVLSPRRDPGMTDGALAGAACLATLAYGAWRVSALAGLRDAARWLKRSIPRADTMAGT